jgi:glycosyltransferase involved in cell wall biosynthesis
LIKLFLPWNVKIVLSHHGGQPPAYRSAKSKLLGWAYSKVSALTFLNSLTREYLAKIKVPGGKMFFLPVGADFGQFRSIEKSTCRDILKIDRDCIYGIYVGSFYRLKSVDVILDIYRAFRTKYNFRIIFVGGNDDEQNDLYKEVIDSGCPFFGRVSWDELVYYYNAADFYIHPAFNPDFGGIDVSWMEALACNIPVLTPQLKYLDFDTSELGIVINSVEESFAKTEYMLNNFKSFTKCRETAITQLDANDAIMKKLNSIYDYVRDAS